MPIEMYTVLHTQFSMLIMIFQILMHIVDIPKIKYHSSTVVLKLDTIINISLDHNIICRS